MKFLVKFAFIHETFRKAEIEAIAEVERLELTIIEYNPDVSYPKSRSTRCLNSAWIVAALCSRLALGGEC